MIVGIGSDIVSVARMQENIAKYKEDAFARRVLVDSEWTQYQTTKNKPALLAKRFAVKEAAAKALGTGFAEGITWRHISTVHDERGKPVIALTDAALQKANDLGVTAVHVTISDEREFAVAFVVLET
ncbi:MAG: holo-ACP synthase [Gammaproteobacteria bacterium]|nr:MAG: holo-ACP synthase [Gammaproteobacteria bacterium]